MTSGKKMEWTGLESNEDFVVKSPVIENLHGPMNKDGEGLSGVVPHDIGLTDKPSKREDY